MTGAREEPVRGLVKVAKLFHWSVRTLERALDDMPDARKPPVYHDHVGYYAYQSEVENWIRLNSMHAARARKLKRLERESRPGLAKAPPADEDEKPEEAA